MILTFIAVKSQAEWECFHIDFKKLKETFSLLFISFYTYISFYSLKYVHS